MKLPVSRVLGTIYLAACLGLSSCQAAAASHNALQNAPLVASSTPLPTQAIESTQPPSLPTATAMPSVIAVGIPSYAPEELRSTLQLPAEFEPADEAGADIRLKVLPSSETQGVKAPETSVQWIYALVAPFPTVTDEVTLSDLHNAWRGGPVKDLEISTLLVDPSTQAVFEKFWGQPSNLVKTVTEDLLLTTAWNQPNTWAIVPFEQLEPRWKVIALDGQSPVQKTFDPQKYGLTVYFALDGSPHLLDQISSGPLAPGNRQPELFTTVALTGVTALVRGTASWMEYFGMKYPADYIGDWLREADILHISNEVPFATNCPAPYPWEGLVFCSQNEYIELLEYIGTDVVELTGDHFQDWGAEAMLNTLQMYQERGWPYYGGGANIEEAQEAAILEHNGNRFAFVGCNAKPEGYSGAAKDKPGAVHCDFDQLTKKVESLRAEGYLPIVTFQHLEYYSYKAHPILQEDFRRVAKAGAVIVSGSQAHQPHAIEFSESIEGEEAFLHYGLGNLFFDQVYEGYPNRQAFIDRHVFYNGKHISTELLTIMFIDYARARPMTAEERTELLTTIFEVSEWNH